jgi:antitoxin VapB
MARTESLKSNRSQAVRLSKEVAFPLGVKDVTTIRDGAKRVIMPANAVWDDFFDRPGIDLPPRDQPAAQKRDDL